LIVGLITSTHFLTGQTDAEGSRTSLTFFDPNYSANYYFISIMVIWASRRPRHRGWRVLAYTLLIVALISTGSNSGMVSLLVGTGSAAILGVFQRRGVLAAIAASAFLLVGGFFLVSNLSLQTIQTEAHGSSLAVVRDGLGRSGASVSERSKVLHESIKLFWRNTPLGAGPTSTKVRLIASMAPYVKEAHDDYFAAVMERGVIGGIGLCLLLGAQLIYVTPLIKNRLKPAYRAVVVRPNALVGALAGTMVAEAVYELLHVRHVWAFYGIIAAIYLWGRDEKAA
jgi:O-antigen ligase